MTAPDLAAIRARLAGRTPGQWRRREGAYHEKQVAAHAEGQSYPIIVVGSTFEEDAEFIANAPDDMAALLAEIDRLHGEIGRERDRYAGAVEINEGLVRTLSTVRANDNPTAHKHRAAIGLLDILEQRNAPEAVCDAVRQVVQQLEQQLLGELRNTPHNQLVRPLTAGERAALASHQHTRQLEQQVAQLTGERDAILRILLDRAWQDARNGVGLKRAVIEPDADGEPVLRWEDC